MSRIKNLLSKHNIRSKKRFGQNFLSDEESLQLIVTSADIKKSDHVLEIGAGIGNLSSLIAPKAGRFYALEKDTSLKKVLNSQLSDYCNTQIIFDDILKFRLEAIFENKKIKVIGNLPYYITSLILFHLLEQKDYVENIFITVQKEVAERIIAKPGNKDYGRLSCLMQYHTKPQLLEVFPRHLFIPRPEVDSALIKINILDKPSVKVKDEKVFFQVVKAIFAQRRKTLTNSLSNAGWPFSKQDIQNILEDLSINGSLRGERLSLAQMGKIADKISGLNNS
jgi:16S rRNA (adenine1518-N6/adenine1519-N6)-dimethyltransferase